jgi:hypothetical protein
MINLLTNAQHILQSTEGKEKLKKNMRIQKCGSGYPDRHQTTFLSTFLDIQNIQRFDSSTILSRSFSPHFASCITDNQ